MLCLLGDGTYLMSRVLEAILHVCDGSIVVVTIHRHDKSQPTGCFRPRRTREVVSDAPRSQEFRNPICCDLDSEPNHCLG